jgi:hypothetical protein
LHSANTQPIFGNGKPLLVAGRHHSQNQLVVKLFGAIASGSDQCRNLRPALNVQRNTNRIRLMPEHVA